MTKHYKERRDNTCPCCGNMLRDPHDKFCAGDACEWDMSSKPKRKKQPRDQD